MAFVTVSMDTTQVTKALSELGSKATTAIRRALNVTVKDLQAQAVQQISSGLNITDRRVKDKVLTRKATTNNLVAELYPMAGGSGVVSGKSKSERRGRIPLYEFQASGPVPSYGRGGGVRYSLPTGRGVAPHAFIATMRSGHVGVFQRLSGSRMPSRPRWRREKIVELFGPSVAHVFASKPVLSVIERNANQYLTLNLAAELDGLIKTGTVPGDEAA